MEGFAGVTAIEVSSGAVTVKIADPLTLPTAAPTVEVPAMELVANPPAAIVATFVFRELHDAVDVRFCVLPLL